MSRKKKSLTLDQPLVEASDYETPLSDDLQEELPEPEPEIILPPPVAVKKDIGSVKVAVTAAVADGLASARSKKTCKKFVGKWINLKQGKMITDAKEVIAHLRAHDLVE